MKRRTFLKSLGSLFLITPMFGLSKETKKTKQLKLNDFYTGKKIIISYREDGNYTDNEIEEINYFFKDRRTKEVKEMDLELLNLLNNIYQKSGSNEYINIISAFRSKKTNKMLRKTTNGVSKRSLHMEGKALDINIPGVKLSKLNRIAKREKIGGVGFYPNSKFIHIDTGRVRSWVG